MRQWELFGITDSQPAWTPPKTIEVVDEPKTIEVVDEPDTIHLVTPEPDEGEQERLVSA
jgi:hypothetical protein